LAVAVVVVVVVVAVVAAVVVAAVVVITAFAGHCDLGLRAPLRQQYCWGE
jgi:hypothetical protein